MGGAEKPAERAHCCRQHEDARKCCEPRHPHNGRPDTSRSLDWPRRIRFSSGRLHTNWPPDLQTSFSYARLAPASSSNINLGRLPLEIHAKLILGNHPSLPLPIAHHARSLADYSRQRPQRPPRPPGPHYQDGPAALSSGGWHVNMATNGTCTTEGVKAMEPIAIVGMGKFSPEQSITDAKSKKPADGRVPTTKPQTSITPASYGTCSTKDATHTATFLPLAST